MLVLYFLVALSSAAQLNQLTDMQWNINGCKNAVDRSATFSDGPGTSTFHDACLLPQNLGSVLDCIYSNIGSNNTEAEDVFIWFCADFAILTRADLHEAYANASNYFIDLDVDTEFNRTVITSHPVKNGRVTSIYPLIKNSLKFMGQNVNKAHYLGAGSVAFWCLLFVFSAVCNWFKVLFPSVTQRFNDRFSRMLRRTIFLPAAFKRSHQNPVKVWGITGLIPTRFESIVIALHTVYCILACSLGYRYQQGDPRYATASIALGRYVGDRAGFILSYQLPLIFLFAGRNNFMQLITRWPFSRFVVFHKWLARTMFVELIVHAVGWSHNYILREIYASNVIEKYFIWGIVATVAGGIMCFTAAHNLRSLSYETFLLIHIAMAVLFLAGAWMHCEETLTQWFFYACAAVWCFDRFLRLCRMASYGVQTAKAELVAGETMRLTLPKGVLWAHFPGAYGFIHFLTPKTFFQSHPFTVTLCEETGKIHMYCKIKGGVTSTLHKKLENGPQDIKICLEGPYGQRYPYGKYDTAILIAGGNGIPGLYDSAMRLARRNVEKTHVKLYWIIREWKSINWFMEELLALKNTSIEVCIYISNPESVFEEVQYQTGSSSDEDVTEKKSPTPTVNIKDMLNFIEIRQGRPQVAQIVSQEISESNGTVAIGACGHPAMCDDIRAAVTENLEGNSRVDYFEELLVW